MEKKRWSCSFLSVNTLIHRIGALLAVSTLLVLGTSTPVMAKCNENNICEKGENAKNCSDCTVEDPPAVDVLKANLTEGAFVFAGPLPIVLDAKQTNATSSEHLVMTRVGAGAFQQEWDCVFLGGENCETNWDGCGLLGYLDNDTQQLVAPEVLDWDDWVIHFGEADSGGLRLKLINSFQANDPTIMGDEVEISMQLIGDFPDYVANPIPPVLSTDKSVFRLDGFILAGDNTVSGTRPRMTCQPGPGSGGHLDRFDLINPSFLTICGGGVAANDCRPD